ncbi:MAG: hypothetical protein FJ214_08335 [Ignavibacteria bacterium]|nr:hypothetical protein [Ignavibacteria bacterium]
MKTFDLAISYTWEYDIEFISLTEKLFQKDGMTTYIIWKHNLTETALLLKEKKIHFKSYLDRASDEDSEFNVISKILKRRKSYLINPLSKIKKSTDKAFMHKKLLRKKFTLPYTVILPPYSKSHPLSLNEKEMSKLGSPYIIKPSTLSGGGQGVNKNARTFLDIQYERMQSPLENYLVQEKIYPLYFDNKRAWFRVLWAFGKPIQVWWNDQTHLYKIVTKEHFEKYDLQRLIQISTQIARITNLDYFSCEIAIAKKHKFYLIDYVNDQCDLRLQSKHVDGVPDSIVIDFVNQMKKRIQKL